MVSLCIKGIKLLQVLKKKIVEGLDCRKKGWISRVIP